MAIYDPKSLKAEEFINDAEIHATLEYAYANKHNAELIDEILEKARPKKTENGTVCAGLSHREAAVLLACDIPEKNQKMFELAEEIKLAFYGNRIVMFAPLYLSNYCVNGCVYCPYHMKNKHITRKKLTQEEVKLLKILLPITLPNAIPELPLMAAPVLITSSGNDVPSATIVRPITSSLILKRRANADAPLVSQSAPRRTSTMPAMNDRIESTMFLLMFFEFELQR